MNTLFYSTGLQVLVILFVGLILFTGITACILYNHISKLTFKSSGYKRFVIVSSWIICILLTSLVVLTGFLLNVFYPIEKARVETFAFLKKQKAELQAGVNTNPYSTRHEVTKVITVDKREYPFGLGYVLLIEFSSQSGRVYRQVASTSNTSQLRLYHELLHAHQTGEPVMVEYRHSEDYAPARALISLSRSDGLPLWTADSASAK